MFKHYCSVCGKETVCSCSEHPAAIVESIYVRSTTMPAPHHAHVVLPPAILPERVGGVQPVSKTHALSLREALRMQGVEA